MPHHFFAYMNRMKYIRRWGLMRNTQAENDMEHIGVYEGGGYQSKGVYRAFMDCRMKTNNTKRFCAVCERAIERVIAHQIMPLEHSHHKSK